VVSSRGVGIEVGSSYFEILHNHDELDGVFLLYLHLVPDQVEYTFKPREPTTNVIITNQCSHIPINLSRNCTAAISIPPPLPTNIVLPYSNIITCIQKQNDPNANPKNAPDPSLYLLSASRDTTLPRSRRHPGINKRTETKLARLRISRKQLMQSILYTFVS
jgi:hypothetical protein